jgi:hypothetical protein
MCISPLHVLFFCLQLRIQGPKMAYDVIKVDDQFIAAEGQKQGAFLLRDSDAGHVVYGPDRGVRCFDTTNAKGIDYVSKHHAR